MKRQGRKPGIWVRYFLFTRIRLNIVPSQWPCTLDENARHIKNCVNLSAWESSYISICSSDVETLCARLVIGVDVLRRLCSIRVMLNPKLDETIQIQRSNLASLSQQAWNLYWPVPQSYTIVHPHLLYVHSISRDTNESNSMVYQRFRVLRMLCVMPRV